MDPKTASTSIKTLGLVALTALVALALFGASSAIAETTALCKSDESPCGTGNGTTSLHETSVGKAKLLSSIGTAECNVLFASTSIGASGNPQKLEGNLTYTNCELGGSSCTETEENGPAAIQVSREGSEKAKVTGEYLVHVKCAGLIDCSFTGTGLSGTFKGPLSATQTNGELTISEQTMTKEAGGFLCPKTNKLDITTTPLAATYLSNGGGGGLSSASTTLSTELSGGGKKGAEISVAEGSKVKDTATLSGENASKAGGAITYKVYSDSKCEKLVTEAGKGEVKEGKLPDSEEKELEAGKEYFWLAEYAGDEMNGKSTSSCSKEVLKVKAKTTLSTLLHGKNPEGEGEELWLEGEESILPEAFTVDDLVTISGTNSSTATGKVSFKIYADGECKELVAEEGESSVEKATALSKEVELKEGTYYWQANYEGDALHQSATNPCGSGVRLVSPFLEMIRAQTPLGGLSGAGGRSTQTCKFKAITELCEVEIKNTLASGTLTITNPRIVGTNAASFEENGGQIGTLPRCNATQPVTMLAAGAKCGQLIKSIGPTTPGVSQPPFLARWVVEGKNGSNQIVAQATAFLEWKE